MFSKIVVSVFMLVCLIELVTACAPSTTPVSGASSATGSSAAAPTTTQTNGRKRRQAPANSASVELHSSVPVSNVGLLLHKLKIAAGNADLDASKFSNVEHKISADPSENAIVTLTVQNVNDCAGLRRNTQKIVKQVSEVTSASISCDGNHYNV